MIEVRTDVSLLPAWPRFISSTVYTWVGSIRDFYKVTKYKWLSMFILICDDFKCLLVVGSDQPRCKASSMSRLCQLTGWKTWLVVLVMARYQRWLSCYNLLSTVIDLWLIEHLSISHHVLIWKCSVILFSLLIFPFGVSLCWTEVVSSLLLVSGLFKQLLSWYQCHVSLL